MLQPWIACVTCNPDLQARIVSADFLPLLGMALVQVLTVAGLVSMLHRLR
jgi:hypothetical protein